MILDMKFFIVGMHSSGKEEIINYLQRHTNIRVGKVFTNAPSTPNIYTCNFEKYENKDIIDIIDNSAYLFLDNIDVYRTEYYEGLALYEYENNDIFAITPNELIQIPQMPQDVVIIWLDNTPVFRRSYYEDHNRTYDFTKREQVEQQNLIEFTDQLYSSRKVMYFSNEEPIRIAVILETMIKYPEMTNKFLNYFK